MTRVRYQKNPLTNNLVSTKSFLLGTRAVSVTINTTEMLFSISALDNGEVLRTGTGPTVSSLKVEAKNSLKELGVPFYDEVRETKPEAVLTLG